MRSYLLILLVFLSTNIKAQTYGNEEAELLAGCLGYGIGKTQKEIRDFTGEGHDYREDVMNDGTPYSCFVFDDNPMMVVFHLFNDNRVCYTSYCKFNRAAANDLIEELNKLPMLTHTKPLEWVFNNKSGMLSMDLTTDEDETAGLLMCSTIEGYDLRNNTSTTQQYVTNYKLDENDDTYTGNLKNDVPDGQGIIIYKSGDRYEGQFINGKKDGKGSFYWVSGSKYVGEYKNDLKEGQGTLTGGAGTGHILNCPGCVKYVGNWKNGVPDGIGMCYDVKGNCIYIGMFSDGSPIETYPTK